MQDRYAGDFGDFVKFTILRAIAIDRSVGLAWWLHPDESHNADGKHVAYLEQPDSWRYIDPRTFDRLKKLIAQGVRSVHAIEAANLFDDIAHWHAPIPPRRAGSGARSAWLSSGVQSFDDRDLICFDPDNGIDTRTDRAPSPKSIGLDELEAFRKPGRTLLVYHHHTRRKGGHLAEIEHIARILKDRGFATVDAIRAPRFSPRVFFLLDADREVRVRAARLAAEHSSVFQWYPDSMDEAPSCETLSRVFPATILTLYPEMFPGPLGVSLAGRALADGKWSCTPVQIRDFATDKHRSVDDTPAGGGAGMVMRADVLARAVDHARAVQPHAPVLAMSPRGAPLRQARVRQLAAGPGVTILCGRFEGIDERLFEARDIELVSIGDYILSGGEMAALTLLDACIRLLPGVMGAPHSGDDESFETGLLEYPHYTRPFEWEGRTIPEVLRSGDHAKVDAWRKAMAEADTRSRRPDLWERHLGARVQSPSGARRHGKDGS